jgi:hypothetical protein
MHWAICNPVVVVSRRSLPIIEIGLVFNVRVAKVWVQCGFAVLYALGQADLRARGVTHNACDSFSAGSAVPEPEDLRSHNGELTVDLTIHNSIDASGSIRYCYTTADSKAAPTAQPRRQQSRADGKAAPNLRVNPGHAHSDDRRVSLYQSRQDRARLRGTGD